MTKEQFNALQPGDLVRHKEGTAPYIVAANLGGRVLLVRATEASNAIEWDLVLKAQHRPPE